MGQIKNIKLHIVTDIKEGISTQWVQKKQADTKKAPSQKAKPSGGSKQKKKKWSKGKTRDKLNNAILFDKATYEKLYKEVPSYKLITPSVVSERLKVRASLARLALEALVEKGLIKEIDRHHAQRIYTRATAGAEE